MLLVASLLAVSLVVNVIQFVRFRSLQGPLNRCMDYLTLGRVRGSLDIGSQVPPIHARDLEGRDVELKVAQLGKLAVIYVFSPTCVWCRRNSQNMGALMEGAGQRFEFIPISLVSAGVREYWSQAGMSGPVSLNPRRLAGKHMGWEQLHRR